MVISHTGIVAPAAKLAAVVAWYSAALAPLGYRKTITHRDGLVNGFSDQENPYKADWWVSVSGSRGGSEEPSPSHHAFRVKDRATVEAFYKAAIDAGGKDNGGPGVRAMYGPNYFAAFVLDPLGNNIEAMINE